MELLLDAVGEKEKHEEAKKAEAEAEGQMASPVALPWHSNAA